ncbi:hypothetical protein MB02_01180 [Croceicoccus estronivorus]|uniref:DUF4376 domain-containing protein n=1 Tax=Croceicoccus estronivorus TaxID=1172626 RepID=UPI000830020C|nr:hypothetical protein [Croceicoccus estronivorus]OCC25315.1 hypothetical protein MB02_01180 [Croceicoccus estronivorus]
MTYSLIHDGAAIRYPYTLAMLRRDNPGSNFPDDFDLADAGDYGVVPVEDSAQPELAAGQTLDEALPVEANGQWLRNWIVHDWLDITPDGLFARVAENGDIVCPYTARDVRRDFGVTARKGGTIRQMDGQWGVVPVTVEPEPAITPEQALEPYFEAGNGVVLQRWTVTTRTAQELEQARALKHAALKDRYTERLLQGWTHDFGAAGTHTLDLRPGTDDKANWTLLLLKTRDMIAAGAGNGIVQIRTSANLSIDLTATDAADAMEAFLAWGDALFDHKWDRDDAIQSAATFAALYAVDIVRGWP